MVELVGARDGEFTRATLTKYLGLSDPDEDIERIRQVAAVLETGDKLVADANTGWVIHEAARVVRLSLQQNNINRKLHQHCVRSSSRYQSVRTKHRRQGVVRFASSRIADPARVHREALLGTTRLCSSLSEIKRS